MDCEKIKAENKLLREELEKCQKLIESIRHKVQPIHPDYKEIIDQLTEREIEIIQLIAAGNTTKEIAQLLDRSPNTIETHRANILAKLGLNNVVELAVLATKAGMV